MKGGVKLLFDNIKKLAKEKNVSISEIEENCKLGKRTIYRWDINSPSIDKVKAVSNFLGVTVDELLKD